MSYDPYNNHCNQNNEHIHYPANVLWCSFKISSEINIKVKGTYLATCPIKICWSGDSRGGCFL